MNLKTEDDLLVSATLVSEDAKIFTVSRNGQGLKFPADKVSVMGRAAAGVKIMALDEGDELVSAFTVTDDDQILQIMENGAAKRMAASEIPEKVNRAGKGVKCLTAINRVGHVVAASAVKEDEDCIVVTKEGMVIRTPVIGISLQSRISNGVKLISLNEGDSVATITIAGKNEVNADE